MSWFGVRRGRESAASQPAHQLDAFADRGQKTPSYPLSVFENPPSKDKWMKPPDPIGDEPRNRRTQDVPALRDARLRQKEEALARQMDSSHPGLGKHVYKAQLKKQLDQLDDIVDQETQRDFANWLLSHGRKEENDRYPRMPPSGASANNQWKTQPLSHHKTVIDFIDAQVEGRQKFEREIAKLKLRYETSGSLENASLDECWIYYKFVIRGFEPTEDELRILLQGDLPGLGRAIRLSSGADDEAARREDFERAQADVRALTEQARAAEEARKTAEQNAQNLQALHDKNHEEMAKWKSELEGQLRGIAEENAAAFRAKLDEHKKEAAAMAQERDAAKAELAELRAQAIRANIKHSKGPAEEEKLAEVIEQMKHDTREAQLKATSAKLEDIAEEKQAAKGELADVKAAKNRVEEELKKTRDTTVPRQEYEAAIAEREEHKAQVEKLEEEMGTQLVRIHALQKEVNDVKEHFKREAERVSKEGATFINEETAKRVREVDEHFRNAWQEAEERLMGNEEIIKKLDAERVKLEAQLKAAVEENYEKDTAKTRNKVEKAHEAVRAKEGELEAMHARLTATEAEFRRFVDHLEEVQREKEEIIKKAEEEKAEILKKAEEDKKKLEKKHRRAAEERNIAWASAKMQPKKEESRKAAKEEDELKHKAAPRRPPLTEAEKRTVNLRRLEEAMKDPDYDELSKIAQQDMVVPRDDRVIYTNAITRVLASNATGEKNSLEKEYIRVLVKARDENPKEWDAFVARLKKTTQTWLNDVLATHRRTRSRTPKPHVELPNPPRARSKKSK